MVKGLERFRDHFRGFEDRYVLIGGTACDVAFDAVGLRFRATKDLDIVLCVDSLDADFARKFWGFVALGGYTFREASTGRTRFYRFRKPAAEGFPAMLELFARAPDVIGVVSGDLTPIPVEDGVSSLSAILLQDEYYEWVRAGRHVVEGLAVLRPEHIIPLKAKAWLDLRERAQAGASIDSRDIRKHKNDVFRLWAIIDPGVRPTLSGAIERDMRVFLDEVAKEPPDLDALGLNAKSVDDVFSTLRAVYLSPR